jgi:hypothetical protein
MMCLLVFFVKCVILEHERGRPSSARVAVVGGQVARGVKGSGGRGAEGIEW